MGKTKTAPQDYNKRVAIIPQLVKLCDQCGERVYMRPDHIVCCGTCRSTTWELLYEDQAETFRRGLQEKRDEEQLIAEARRLALSLAPQMDVALEFIGAVLNMDAGTEALLNSWIAEEQSTKILGSRFIVSGGDVYELDTKPEADDEELPF
jgi:hypothetical protein